mmetsp:Transcript_11091/g.35232  ORF Transcript_11091/g.35232 Transcript_11091/m.35232 type:complete len:520 (-) Transcript_11091:197-1756(-)
MRGSGDDSAAPSPAPHKAGNGESGELPTVDVGVFWDFENVRIPRDFKASSVSAKIRDALLAHGHIMEQNLYYDSRKTTEQNTDRVNLDSTGWHLVDCPTRGQKETLDKKLIVDVMQFAWEHRSRQIPCCVVLITSDGDYSYTLAKIRNLGCKTVVIYGEMTTTAGVLLDTCEIALSWVHEVLAHDDEAVAEDDAELVAKSIDDAVDGRHLTLLHAIREQIPKRDGWTLDAVVAKSYYKKRGGAETSQMFSCTRESAHRGGFVDLGRQDIATKCIVLVESVAWSPSSMQNRLSTELYVRLTDFGAAQLDRNTHDAAAMVLQAHRSSSPQPKVVPSHKPGNWKTQLCSFYSRKGACPKADKCDFAHGIHELRRPKQLVVRCRFWSGQPGTCHSGLACPFYHDPTLAPKPPKSLPPANHAAPNPPSPPSSSSSTSSAFSTTKSPPKSPPACELSGDLSEVSSPRGAPLPTAKASVKPVSPPRLPRQALVPSPRGPPLPLRTPPGLGIAPRPPTTTAVKPATA